METKIKSRLLLPLLTALISFLSFSSNAQSIPCTYQINNNTTCTLKVDVTFYDVGVCHTVTGINIFPSSNVGVNCATCGPLTDLKVDVVGWNGNASTNFSVDINNQTDSDPTGCSSGMNMDWHPNNTDIYP